ncbi:hypothetical protein [Nocardia sp. CS682]|nr:hypothetical protein [Nocardia sp. CS682]
MALVGLGGFEALTISTRVVRSGVQYNVKATGHVAKLRRDLSV